MKDQNQFIKPLIRKYIDGSASISEIVIVSDWIKTSEENARLFKNIETEILTDNSTEAEEDWLAFANKYELNQKKHSKRWWLTFVSVSSAASVCMLIVVSFYFFRADNTDYLSQINESRDITHTLLQLPGGKEIELDKKHATVVAKDNGSQFVIEQEKVVEQAASDKHELSSLMVPYGKTAQLSLADGTQVWLNAGSQLIFPNHFNDVDERKVMLVGEAYFDVVHNNEKPFKVVTEDVSYTVLGTSFNIRSYKNGNANSATLTIGSLQVEQKSLLNKQRTILKPGQQSIFNKSTGRIKVHKVNTHVFTSWKEGYLTLERNSLRLILGQIEAYYNCEISINEELIKVPVELSGKLLLDDEVEDVCKALSDLTGLSYSSNNQQIHFYNK